MIYKSIKKIPAIKFQIKSGNKETARAFLYIIKNDLHKKSYGLLEDLFVQESARGQGLGSQLLLRVVAEAKKLKLYKLIGTSRTERRAVHKFYVKHGFKKYGYEFRRDL